MGLPRRVFDTTYNGAPQAQSWQLLTDVSAFGGLILFVSAMFFVLVMLGTLLAGKRKPQPAIEWTESLGEPAGGYTSGLWDRLGLWFVVAVVLVLIAYAIPLIQHLQMTTYGSPGFKPF